VAGVGDHLDRAQVGETLRELRVGRRRDQFVPLRQHERGGPLEPRLPAWMAVVIVLREIAVTGLRGIASQHGVVIPAQELGKYKMIFQIFALTGLLTVILMSSTNFAIGSDFKWVLLVPALLWIAGVGIYALKR
jgi:phosphatidylglycerophosphate synthase